MHPMLNNEKNAFISTKKNGIEDTGYTFSDGGEIYLVLSSDPNHFQLHEYKRLLNKFSLGLYRPKILVQ